MGNDIVDETVNFQESFPKMENQHATHPRRMHPPSNRGPPTNFARGSPRGLPREPPLPIDEMNRLRSLMTKFQQQQSQQQQQQQRQNRSHQQQRHLQVYYSADIPATRMTFDCIEH